MKHGLAFLVVGLLALTGCSSGPSTSSDARALFEQNKSQTDSCYQKVSKKEPDLGTGTVELKFQVGDDGKSHKTLFMKKKSTLSNKMLNACLKKVVSSWDFPAGKATDVIYDFNFESMAPAGDTATEPKTQSDLDVIDTTPQDDGAGSGDEQTPTE